MSSGQTSPSQQGNGGGLWNGRGLTNFGSTCYMNAVIQSLSRCKEYTRRILAVFEDGNVADADVMILYHLRQVFQELRNTSVKVAFKPALLFRALPQLYSASVHVQHDAMEPMRWNYLLICLILSKRPFAS